MSGTSSSGVESFGRVDILDVGRTYRVLSKELVCKGLDGCPLLNPKYGEEIQLPPPQEEILKEVLADQIVSALDNLSPDDSENEILDLIENTFAVACLKKRLENQTNCVSNSLRKAFYERMSSHDPGVGVNCVTHSDEQHEFEPDEHPIIPVAVDFLLDEDRGGAKIPTPVESRAEELWDLLQKKAEEWSTEYSIAETETCKEVISATIAVEVHTGGNPDHIRPYKEYIFKERGATWSQLDEDPTHPVDKSLVRWYEDKCGKDSR